MIAIIEKYFPTLTEHQKEQLRALYALYADWNAKINVVSRKDFEQLYLRHVLHSLAIAKVCQFETGARVLDVGCGGGFPSVPLAIMFPDVKFISADSIGKKITVVKGVCEGAGITNIDARHTRVEQIPERFDYVVSRAVTEMPQFVKWIWSKIDRQDTLSLMKEVGYDSAFMFQYSLRPNTKAARHFVDDVPLAEKTRRLNEIIELQNTLSLASNQKTLGKVYQVLIEGVSKRSDEQLVGRTPQNKACVFDAKGYKIGDYVNVKIISCTSATLIAEIVEEATPEGAAKKIDFNDIRNDLKEIGKDLKNIINKEINNLIGSKNDKD